MDRQEVEQALSPRSAILVERTLFVDLRRVRSALLRAVATEVWILVLIILAVDV